MIYTKSKIMKQNYTHYNNDYDYITKTNLPCNIRQAYKKPSDNKLISFAYWCNKITQYGAYGIRILSATCQRYTIGYLFDKDGETYFGYITPQYHRYCNIKEL